MFERVLARVRKSRLRCAVVTPIGPGHLQTYRDCERSINAAWQANRGPFTALGLVPVDDSAGRLGRSLARNEGVRKAAAAGAEWIFFLDADDLMLPEAFAHVSDLVDRYDAIWGLINSCRPDASDHHLRLPQILSIDRIESLFVFDPFLTLQMGHFVRTAAALAIPFDGSMDAGEDFDYYLRLWGNFRCAKVPRSFFVARHGHHSHGPRSAAPEQWRSAVESRLARERARHALDAESPAALEIKNAAVRELQAFYRGRGLADATNVLALAREMPYRGSVEIEIDDVKPYEMYSDNDDWACLSLAWTGEYRFASSRLWHTLAQSARVIVDVGSGTGFYALLAARSTGPDSVIHCFEPRAANFERLLRNIAANEIANIDAVHAAAGRARGEWSPHVSAAMGLTATRGIALESTDARERERVPVISIDDLMRERGQVADLVRIDLAGFEIDVFHGMRSMIEAARPDILLGPSPIGVLERAAQLLSAQGYRCLAVGEEDARFMPIAQAANAPHTCWLTVRNDADLHSIIEKSGGDYRSHARESMRDNANSEHTAGEGRISVRRP